MTPQQELLALRAEVERMKRASRFVDEVLKRTEEFVNWSPVSDPDPELASFADDRAHMLAVLLGLRRSAVEFVAWQATVPPLVDDRTPDIEAFWQRAERKMTAQEGAEWVADGRLLMHRLQNEAVFDRGTVSILQARVESFRRDLDALAPHGRVYGLEFHNLGRQIAPYESVRYRLEAVCFKVDGDRLVENREGTLCSQWEVRSEMLVMMKEPRHCTLGQYRHAAANIGVALFDALLNKGQVKL